MLKFRREGSVLIKIKIKRLDPHLQFYLEAHPSVRVQIMGAHLLKKVHLLSEAHPLKFHLSILMEVHPDLFHLILIIEVHLLLEAPPHKVHLFKIAKTNLEVHLPLGAHPLKVHLLLITKTKIEFHLNLGAHPYKDHLPIIAQFLIVVQLSSWVHPQL